jgi:hypothetical protein
MNNSRQENGYKYFCTTDPATWETHEHNTYAEQNADDLREPEQGGGLRKWEEARGRLTGRKRGGGGGNTQKKVEKEWEEVRRDTRAGGSNEKDKVNGNAQREASRNINASGVRGGDNGNGAVGDRQAAGSRAYRQNEQRVLGPSQTMLNDVWKGKEIMVQRYGFTHARA